MEATAPQQQQHKQHHHPPPPGSHSMNSSQDHHQPPQIVSGNMVPSGAEGQILPMLLTRAPSLTPNSSDPNDQSDLEIIEQVISLEDDYSETAGHLMPGGAPCGDVISTGVVDRNNHLSSSAEDFYMFRDYDQTNSSPMITTSSNQVPDEKMRIEKIREQLKSCEVQPESHMCPINTMQPCQTPVSVNQLHHTSSTHIATTQTAPVTMHHPHHMQSAPPPPHPPMNSEQMMQTGYPSMANVSRMPVMSNDAYAPSPTQVSQATSVMVGSMDGTSQQRQTSFSPHSPYCQTTPHTSKQYFSTISTPVDVALTPQPEASPVVRKNPLLNAHLANKTKTTQSLQTRYVNVASPTTNVVHQNPILNAKLSGVFAPNSGNIQSVGPSPNQPRYVQAPSNYTFEQHQQHQHQQPQQMALYGLDSSQVYRNVNAPNTITMANNSNISSAVSHQVKEGLRRKVSSQQPKQETSLLKQLLSDDK